MRKLIGGACLLVAISAGAVAAQIPVSAEILEKPREGTVKTTTTCDGTKCTTTIVNTAV